MKLLKNFDFSSFVFFLIFKFFSLNLNPPFDAPLGLSSGIKGKKYVDSLFCTIMYS